MDIKINRNFFIFSVILILAIFVRCYRFGQIPDGLQQDETSIGYNAYSIAQTGSDEHGRYLPQNFQAFGEYKLPGYIYATSIAVKYLGLSETSIRLTSLLTGLIIVIAVYFLTDELIRLTALSGKQPKISFISDRLKVPQLTVMLFTALNPWQIHFSRAAYETMMACACIIGGLTIYLTAVRKKRPDLIYLALIFFALSVYTYNIARLFTPVFLIFLFIFTKNRLQNLNKIHKYTIPVFILTLLAPFAWGALNHGGADSTLSTMIFTSAKVQAPLLEFRSYFSQLPLWLTRFFMNNPALKLRYYAANLIATFNLNYFFVNGGNNPNNAVGSTGQWYMFELPLVVLGGAFLFSSYKKIFWLLTVWITLVILISAMTYDPPQATRMFFLAIPVTVLSAFGFIKLTEIIANLKPWSRFMMLTGGGLIMTYSFFWYFTAYYFCFPINSSRHWRLTDRELTRYLMDIQSDYRQVIFDTNTSFKYTSLLYYLKYPPADFQHEAVWAAADSEGFTYPVSFGKYLFKPIDFQKDWSETDSLLVTDETHHPITRQPLQVIYYPERPVVNNIGQIIQAYPYREPAYFIYSTGRKTQVGIHKNDI